MGIYAAALLLVLVMLIGLRFWLEDHDDTRQRVIKLGSVTLTAVILLAIIYFIGR